MLPVLCVGKDQEGKSALEVKDGPNITFQQNWELMSDELSRERRQALTVVELWTFGAQELCLGKLRSQSASSSQLVC